MTFTGEVLPYFAGLVYSISGAVMGSMPGAEFLAAAEAARSTGAAVVLADRTQQATMKRLAYFTHHLARRDSRARADMDRMRRAMDAHRAQQAAGASATDAAESERRLDLDMLWAEPGLGGALSAFTPLLLQARCQTCCGGRRRAGPRPRRSGWLPRSRGTGTPGAWARRRVPRRGCGGGCWR